MTVSEIIALISNNPKPFIAYYAIVLAIAIIAALYVNRDNFKKPFTYLFSVLIYAVSIPGIVSVMMVVYGFFFQRVNFLNVNILAYFVPIAVLMFVFVMFNKVIGLKNIPGFKRIIGLFLMIGFAFLISYILQRMFFGVIFFGKFQTLLIIFGVILLAIKIGWDRLVK